MNPPTGRPKQTPEQAELFSETRKLEADLFVLLLGGEIAGHQRMSAENTLARARQFATIGHLEQARLLVAGVADIIAGLRRTNGDRMKSA
jgi:hypothetical protein